MTGAICTCRELRRRAGSSALVMRSERSRPEVDDGADRPSYFASHVVCGGARYRAPLQRHNLDGRWTNAMKTLMLALSICSLSACALDQLDEATEDPAQTATDEQAIIGGTTDTGDACVVGVFAHAAGSTSGSICTGTIIGAHTVLTAAHCVSPASIG